MRNQTILQSALDWADQNPAKTMAAINIPGDLAMAVSGLVMQNPARCIAGLFGASSQIPVFFFGDKKEKGEISLDPQDEKYGFKRAVEFIIRPDKYPFEFQAMMNLIQTSIMGTLSGPSIGAQEPARASEIVMGWGASGIMLLQLIRQGQDQNLENNQTEIIDPQPIANMSPLRKAFGEAASFTKRLPSIVYNDISTAFNFAARHGRELFTHGPTYAAQSAVTEISVNKPNAIAAKLFNYFNVPYAAEAAYRQDIAGVTCMAIYILGNIYLAKSSKRIEPQSQLQPNI